jgi:hypothetical protein
MPGLNIGLAVAASIIRLVLIVFTGQSKDVSHAFMRINMLGYGIFVVDADDES